MQYRIDIATFLGCHKGDRHEVKAGKRATNVVAKIPRRELRFHQVPFIDDEDARLVMLEHVPRELFIHQTDLFRSHPRSGARCGSANRLLRSSQAIEFDIVFDLASVTNAGGVDRGNGFAIAFKRTSTLSRVVPSTSLTIVRSSLARALINVLLPVLRPTMASFKGTSSRGGGGPGFGGKALAMASNSVAGLAVAAYNAVWLSETELIKLTNLVIKPVEIGLVDDEQHRFVDSA